MASKSEKKAAKSDKKGDSASVPDNAMLASMIAQLRTDMLELLTGPDSLTAKIDAIAARLDRKITAIEERADAIQATVNSHEQRLSDVEAGLTSLQVLEAQVDSLTREDAALKAKVADLEGRSRRNNIRVVGIPESIEGTRPTAFFSNLLFEVLGEDVLPTPPELERAHRTLRQKPAKKDPPRAVVMCFSRFQVKEAVIRAARERRGKLTYDGKPIHIYEDFPPAVLAQRAKYKDVMQRLYNLQLKPTLRYPARLFIKVGDGERQHLESVAEAEGFLATYEEPRSDAGV